MSDVTEVSQEAPPAAARSWRPVWLAMLAIVVGAVSIPVIAASILVGPYLVDDWRLDHIVRAVALDWRDFGLEKAQARLQYELDSQGIGEQIGDETCRFVDAAPAGRAVQCAWSVKVKVPGTQTVMPMSFESSATISQQGDLI